MRKTTQQKSSNKIAAYVQDRLLERKLASTADELDALADGTSNIEHFKDGLEERRSERNEILRAAQVALERLSSAEPEPALAVPPSGKDGEAAGRTDGDDLDLYEHSRVALTLAEDNNHSSGNSPTPYFLSRSSKAAYERFFDVVKQGSPYFVIVGETGIGKSALLKHLGEMLASESEIAPLMISGSHLSFDALIRYLHEHFRMAGRESQSGIDSLLEVSKLRGNRLFLFLDNAHQLPFSTLRSLAQAMAGSDADPRGLGDALFVVLAGRPELLESLRESGLARMADREPLQQWLGPMLPKEIPRYLDTVGVVTSRNINDWFTAADFHGIANATRGNPAKINRFFQMLVESEKTADAVAKKPAGDRGAPVTRTKVDWTPAREQLNDAVEHTDDAPRTPTRYTFFTRSIFLGAAAFFLLIGAGWLFYHYQMPPDAGEADVAVAAKAGVQRPSARAANQPQQLVESTGDLDAVPADKSMADSAMRQKLVREEEHISRNSFTRPKGDKAQATYRNIPPWDSKQLEALAEIETINAKGNVKASPNRAERKRKHFRAPLDQAPMFDTADLTTQAGLTQPNKKRSAPEKLRELLEKAEAHVRGDRLTAPKFNNALAIYRRILRWEPQQPEALAGVEAIKKKLLRFAFEAQAERDWETARYQISKVLKIVREDEATLAALKQMKAGNNTNNATPLPSSTPLNAETATDSEIKQR